jgi:hypothetical protein
MPTVVVGGVTSFVIIVIGGAYAVGGIALAAAGIAEAGATCGAGILVTCSPSKKEPTSRAKAS